MKVLVRPQQSDVVDVVERGEEGGVEVCEAEFRGVLGRNAHSGTEDRVVRPDPVLQEQREQADRERQVEAGLFAGKSGKEGAEVTFEEQRLRVEIEFAVELAIAVAAAEFEAGEFVVLLERCEEGVDALGAGEFEVDVEIQPGSDLPDIPPLVAVVGNGRAPVAVDRETRQQWIQLAEDRAARLIGAGGVLRASEFEQRAGRINFGFGTVDVGLRLGVVLHFVERIGTEQVFLAVRASAFGRGRFSGAVGFLIFERHVFRGSSDIRWPRPQFAEPAAALLYGGGNGQHLSLPSRFAGLADAFTGRRCGGRCEISDGEKRECRA